MEIFFKVTPLYVNFLCPRCRKGYMNVSGEPLLVTPPSYPHKCTHDLCGHRQNFRGIYYPHIRNIVDGNPLDPQPDITPAQQIN